MSEQTGKSENKHEVAASNDETLAAKPAPSKADILNAQWHRVRSRLRAELGEATFNSWFKLLEVSGAQKGRVTLQVPTRFVRSWIEAHYLTRIRDHWQAEDKTVRRIDIELQPEWTPSDKKPAVREQKAVAARKSPMAPPSQTTSPPAPARVPQATFEQGSRDELGAPLDARFTFDNFIVGKSNELAHAAARRLAEGKGVVFNPLFLYGGVGLGKTHLMHAIAWEIRRQDPSRTVLYLSAEKFMYQFIRALRFKDTMAFKQQFREVDVLMIDDIQFIAGKDSTQEEFFHTFNALIDHNRQVIISADRSPTDLEGIEERIRSRLGWGLVADIHPTDYELRLGILQSKAEALSTRADAIATPQPVLEFLAQRIVSNVRELEGALNRVVAYASFVGRPISLEMAQDVLRDLLRASERRVTIDEIQRRVAEYFNVKMGDMLSARRARSVARPRQIAMYLSKQLTTRSLPEIGRKFGGRDHTTVIHAVRKIEQLREEDAALDEDVDLLRRMLEN
ncbi:MAG: chromosomal replication initiator protein DnaA [Rhodobiaceae bacterium]|nr:chromosomal replication initiator protein DnaA [Rhodobiaceae bacterium]